MIRKLDALSLLAPAFLLVTMACGFAQEFPSRSIRIVSSVGGGSEIVVRMIAERMSVTLGQPIVVDPQSAAAGVMAANTVVRAPPDGYTLLMGTSNTHIYRPLTLKSILYDPVKDFTPISMLTQPTFVLVVNADLDIHDVPGFIAYARKTGKLLIGTPGVGGTAHTLLLALHSHANFPYTSVPYKDDMAPVMGILAGELQAAVTTGSAAGRQMSSNRLRAIGVFHDARRPGFEEVKTISEQLPGFRNLSGFGGMFGPAGMPPAVIARLNAAVVEALRYPELREKILMFGSVPWPTTPEETAAVIRDELPRARALLKEANIEPE